MPLDIAPDERIALHPLLSLTGVQAAAGGVLPDSSLPVSWFVPPERLGPLQSLHGVLKKAWGELVRAAHCRGRTVEADAGERILWGIAAELWRRDPALAEVVSLDEQRRMLVPRAPLQGEPACYPITHLELARGRGERARGSVALDVPGALASTGRLLGLVAAGASPELVGALLVEEPAGAALWQLLLTTELVAPAPLRARFADELPPGTVAHLGHATLLANLGGAFVLIDPWLPAAAPGDAPPPPSPSEMPPLAAILITHHHFDHAHVESLLALDKRVPVVVPRQPEGLALTARTERMLGLLGFLDVRSLAAGASFAVGEGGRVTVAPFFGEDPTRIGYAGACYVLAHEGRACLVHVDSAADADDRTLVSTGAAVRLVAAHGPLSPVFATRRQERGTMIDYTWEALLRPASEWVAPTENCSTGGELLAALCVTVGAGCLSLYSEGGADWYPEWTNFIPSSGTAWGPALAAPYQYLWEPLDAIAREVSAAGAETIVSRPYQRYRIGGGSDGQCRPRQSADRY